MSSDENQKTEQITVEPEQKVKKVKDPKRVEAGKRLVEYHKKAKAALNEVKESKDDYSWLTNINFATVIGVVGIGLTATDLYFRLRKKEEKKQPPPAAPTIASPPVEERKFNGFMI